MENNIYIIAKRFRGRGSLAYRCKTAGEARRLSKTLSDMEADGLQIVVLNSPEMYSEYAPYTDVEELEDFIARVSQMGRRMPMTSTIAAHSWNDNSENKSPPLGR